MNLTDAELFLTNHQKDKQLWLKIAALMDYVMANGLDSFADVKYKFTDYSKLPEATIKEIFKEQGFGYISDIMDTITGFEFQSMLSFVDLINQLKGTRKGLELVLKLLGFDSVIKEWWEDTLVSNEPWTYEIIVIMNSSYVPDIYNTLAKVQVFSQNYVLAKISNIDVRFAEPNFATRQPLMGGFIKRVHRGTIVQRVS